MLLAIALSLPLFLPSGDPPIRVKLSDDVFARGERARVRVKATQNGYLLVLRADAQGRIRVLFPLEPTDAAAIRAGKELEVRGRGDRDAFTVDDGEGSGKILAAIFAEPFRTDAFARGGHWDYRALALADSGGAADTEATLLALVQQMAGGAYDYDIATYTVTNQPRYRRAPMWGWGGWGGRWGGWYGPRCYRCGWW